MNKIVEKLLTNKSARDAKDLKGEVVRSAAAFQPWQN